MKNHPLILFDGICNLCNGTVDFIIKRKSRIPFRFVMLQSEAGEKLVKKYKIPSKTDSVILIDKNKVYVESEAVIEIARRLPYPWKLAVGFKILPKKWRNNFYCWIAGNRYRWFGTKSSCRLPDSEEKILFPDVSDLNL